VKGAEYCMWQLDMRKRFRGNAVGLNATRMRESQAGHSPEATHPSPSTVDPISNDAS
jgi:hypothetical protein